ncbi:MAG: hypothetical protein U1F68_10685 [Gammaproteobacteria bacterium]
MTSVFPFSTAPALTASPPAWLLYGVTGWFMHLAELGTVATILPFQARWGRRRFREPGRAHGSIHRGSKRLIGGGALLLPE